MGIDSPGTSARFQLHASFHTHLHRHQRADDHDSIDLEARQTVEFRGDVRRFVSNLFWTGRAGPLDVLVRRKECDLSNSQKTNLQLIGGVRIGAATPGDYRFYIELFERLPNEVTVEGNFSRFVAFDNLAYGDNRITFLGIEVDQIEKIPDGMIAWDLSDDRLTMIEAKDSENSIFWQDELTWQWRDESPPEGDRRVTGEFSARIPSIWHRGNVSERQHFSMTANSYILLDQPVADDRVYLVDYDRAWPVEFERFAQWLAELLGPDIALRIEHFGSTAITDMPAKPIVDVLVEIPSFDAAKQRAIPLLNLPIWEYWWYGDHMTFVRREQLMGRRTHHIHMMPAGEEFQRRLAFRDYLRAHPEDAERYATLKRKLVETHPTNREAYTDAKAAFVGEIVTKATGDS